VPEFSREFADEMLYAHGSTYVEYNTAERVLAIQGIVYAISHLKGLSKNPFESPRGIDTDTLIDLIESKEVELLPDEQKDQARALWLRIMV
jgi:hypothetical protein